MSLNRKLYREPRRDLTGETLYGVHPSWFTLLYPAVPEPFVVTSEHPRP